MTDTASASRAPATANHGVDPSQIAELATSVASEVGCAVYDVQWRGGTLVVLASPAQGGPIGTDLLSRLSRSLSAELDSADIIKGHYVLEVSSPGLERKLGCPAHFAGAVGERVVIRTSESPRRRIVGEITHADADGVRVAVEDLSGGEAGCPPEAPVLSGQTLTVPYRDIAKARTTFDWGPRPSQTSRSGNANPGRKPGRSAREGSRR